MQRLLNQGSNNERYFYKYYLPLVYRLILMIENEFEDNFLY